VSREEVEKERRVEKNWAREVIVVCVEGEEEEGKKFRGISVKVLLRDSHESSLFFTLILLSMFTVTKEPKQNDTKRVCPPRVVDKARKNSTSTTHLIGPLS